MEIALCEVQIPKYNRSHAAMIVSHGHKAYKRLDYVYLFRQPTGFIIETNSAPQGYVTGQAGDYLAVDPITEAVFLVPKQDACFYLKPPPMDRWPARVEAMRKGYDPSDPANEDIEEEIRAEADREAREENMDLDPEAV